MLAQQVPVNQVVATVVAELLAVAWAAVPCSAAMAADCWDGSKGPAVAVAAEPCAVAADVDL